VGAGAVAEGGAGEGVGARVAGGAGRMATGGVATAGEAGATVAGATGAAETAATVGGAGATAGATTVGAGATAAATTTTTAGAVAGETAVGASLWWLWLIILAFLLLLIFALVVNLGGCSSSNLQQNARTNREFRNILHSLDDKTKGANPKLVFSTKAQADFDELKQDVPTDQDQNSSIDVRVLALLDYLTDKHSYVKVELLKTGAPEQVASVLFDSGATDPSQGTVVNSPSRLQNGQGVIISAVDYSRTSGSGGGRVPINFSQQQTYNEQNVRKSYANLQTLVYGLFTGIPDSANCSAVTSENVANYSQGLGATTEIADTLLALDGISNSSAKQHFLNSKAKFTEARAMLQSNELSSFCDAGFTNSVKAGISSAIKGMQVINAMDGRNSDSRALEARNKIREVTLDVLNFPLRYTRLSFDAGEVENKAEAEKYMKFESLKLGQIITFSPEDNLTLGLPDMDVFDGDNGITGVNANGVEFSDGNDEVNQYDNWFSRLALTAIDGVITKSGDYFLYPKEATDIPTFNNECANMQVFNQLVGTLPESFNEEWRVVPVSYCSMLYISY
jgi:hypothetical protein